MLAFLCRLLGARRAMELTRMDFRFAAEADIQMRPSNRYAAELRVTQGKHYVVAPGTVDK